MASQETPHGTGPVVHDDGIGAEPAAKADAVMAASADATDAPIMTATDASSDAIVMPSSPVITPTVRSVAETDEPTPSRLRVAWWWLTEQDWRAKATAVAFVLACLLTVFAVSQAIWRATMTPGVDRELQEWALSGRDADNELSSSDLFGGDVETPTEDGTSEGPDAASDEASGSTSGNASGNGSSSGTGASSGTSTGGQNTAGDGTQDTPSDDPADDVDPTPDPGQPDDGKDEPSDGDGRWTGYY
ncbi:hypothetical protein [Bifidobacterium samirii]|uniref:Uncharacterized protein n=1 Tax=Bifidobacterium samirii TaxID=2306974 RepID=A0A430FVV0_9BIFI|nr:hypothetical protein [Bifidobacterium samirii]RSX58062.1 hypothetical protein D2E24_0422 [Bifidobacterium samirii]